MILAPLECVVDVVNVADTGLEQVLGNDGKASGLPKGVMVVRGLERLAYLVLAEGGLEMLRNGDPEVVNAEAVLVDVGGDIHRFLYL